VRVVVKQRFWRKTTGTGLDEIRVWFSPLGTPVFAAPLAQLFNRSVLEDVVRRQWKTAVLSPIPKASILSKRSDYTLILITPVFFCCLEKNFVRSYIYPALHLPHPRLRFDDQFAF